MCILLVVAYRFLQSALRVAARERRNLIVVNFAVEAYVSVLSIICVNPFATSLAL